MYKKISETFKEKEKTEPTLIFLWVISALWIFMIIAAPVTLFVLNGCTYSFISISLNEVGDYLAGVAAPLAFFWLVYGYIQQGRELRNSTKALKLQYDELKNSVEAQNEQAKNTKEQSVLILKDKFYPKFILKNFTYKEDEYYVDITLENSKNDVNFYQCKVEIFSDNMFYEDNISEDEGKINFTIQTTDDIAKKFDIFFKIKFVLEIGYSADICYKIHYSHFLNTNGTRPKLEIISCEEIDR